MIPPQPVASVASTTTNSTLASPSKAVGKIQAMLAQLKAGPPPSLATPSTSLPSSTVKITPSPIPPATVLVSVTIGSATREPGDERRQEIREAKTGMANGACRVEEVAVREEGKRRRGQEKKVKVKGGISRPATDDLDPSTQTIDPRILSPTSEPAPSSATPTPTSKTVSQASPSFVVPSTPSLTPTRQPDDHPSFSNASTLNASTQSAALHSPSLVASPPTATPTVKKIDWADDDNSTTEELPPLDDWEISPSISDANITTLPYGSRAETRQGTAVTRSITALDASLSSPPLCASASTPTMARATSGAANPRGRGRGRGKAMVTGALFSRLSGIAPSPSRQHAPLIMSPPVAEAGPSGRKKRYR